MLCVSRFLNDTEEESNDDSPFIGGLFGDEPKKEQRELHDTFNELVMVYLDDYIYKNHLELEKYMVNKKIKEDIKQKLRSHNTYLIKLFKKYASLDNDEITTKHEQNIDVDEWSAMAVELCRAAKQNNKQIWKLGGKPQMNEIVQCFILCKNEELLLHDEIDFIEFQRCLLYFTAACFKYQPNVKYQIKSFENKLELVLKWCDKLEQQKIRITSNNYTRSDTLKSIKRKKSLHGNATSNQSNVSQLSYNYSATMTPRSNDFSTPTSSANLDNLSQSY